MKKRLLFSVMVFTCFFATAQIKVGLKGGLNLSNVTLKPGSQDESFKTKPGFHLGALASIPLKGKFSLQAELNFSEAGTKDQQFDGDTSNINFGYFNIPVLLKYNSPIGIYAEIGPQLGILTSAKRKSLGYYGNGSTSDLKDSYKSTDVAGIVGIGYVFPFHLGIDARYSLGLTNILKNGGAYNLKNNIIQIGIFYELELTSKK